MRSSPPRLPLLAAIPFILLATLVQSAHSQDVQNFSIELIGSPPQQLSGATISIGEREAEFVPDGSLYRFETDAQWFGDRAILPATITPIYPRSDFFFGVNTYRCVKAWGCDSTKLTLPPPLEDFDMDEVRAKCSDKKHATTRNMRLAKYLYCRESFRIMQRAEAVDARSYPTSSFALWGW